MIQTIAPSHTASLFSSVDAHKLAKLAWQALFLVAKTTALGQTDLLRGKSIRVHDRVWSLGRLSEHSRLSTFPEHQAWRHQQKAVLRTASLCGTAHRVISTYVKWSFGLSTLEQRFLLFHHGLARVVVEAPLKMCDGSGSPF
ncbi:hypothetical protein BR93DRAFT_721603 [Coniochaeta sp. PMI_546]|nr:hypothetical protein BR93DRAFT_721603 [Coniochaeta sp. PMI_546]